MRSAIPVAGGRLPALALAAVTALVFAPGVFGEFVWDDKALIVRGTTDLVDAVTSSFWEADADGHAQTGARYYRPVISAAYVLQRAAFGLDPLGFHVVNLLLHLACVLLGYRWLVRRVGASEPATLVATALACALFAVHPSRPESVTWISGSTDLWMTLWLLAGLEAWDRRTRGWRVAAIPAFALAALSKEAAWLVPALLLIDALALRPAEERRREVRAALGAGVAHAALLALRLALLPLQSLGPRHASLSDAVQQVLASIGWYVGRTLWPWPPSVQLGLLRPDGTFDHPPLQLFLGAAAVAAAVALPLIAIRRRALRPWLADAAWWALPLLPVINLVPLGYEVLVADRFLYLPLLGVAALVARALGPLFLHADWRRTAAMAAIGGAAGLSGVASTLHAGNLYDNVSLWRHELSLDPDHPKLLIRLAGALWTKRELEEAAALALDAFERAQDDFLRIRAATDWAAIRSEMLSDAEQEELVALRAFYEAIAAGEADAHTLQTPRGPIVVPIDGDARDWTRTRPQWATYRAILWARTGNLQAAEGILREVVDKKPNMEAWANLLLVVALQERWDDARALAASARNAPGFGPVAEAMARKVERVASRPFPPEPELHDAERAFRWLELGNGLLARRAVAPHLRANPADPAYLSLGVNAEILLREWGRARAAIARARAADPDSAAVWDQLVQHVEDAERGALGRPAAAVEPAALGAGAAPAHHRSGAASEGGLP